MNKRIFLLLVLGCILSSRAFAEDAPPDPCAQEYKAAMDPTARSGSFADTQKALSECQARETEKRKNVTAATGPVWATKLDPLSSGGWEVQDVTADGISVLFGSRRHEVRKGTTVTVWLRDEFRETQVKNGQTYKGLVERDVYDCERMTTKVLSVTYYAENNLQASGNSYAYDEGAVRWIPIIPGTVGESILDWACKSPKQAAH